MADAQILFDEDVAGTLATDTTWVDTALIPAASFDVSTEYIVIAVASVRHASAANETRARLVHGAGPTILTDASVAWEGLSGTQHHQVQWLRRFTTTNPAGDLRVQLSSSSTTDVTNDYSAILAFRASDLGVEDTDWFWNEDTADYTMTSTPTAKASETTTPNGTDRWLVIAEGTWDAVSITTPIGFELHDGTSVLAACSFEAEDATNDFLTQMLMWAGVPTNSSKTWACRPFNSGSSIMLSNRVFALNLASFAQSASDQNAAEVTPATAASWANVATVAITPTTTGDFVIISSTVGDMNNVGDDLRMRMQVDDGGGLASDPAYGDDSPGIDNWDATDEIPWSFLKKRSLTSGASRTVNVDAQTAAAANARIEDRSLVVFSVALSGAASTNAPAGNAAGTGAASGGTTAVAPTSNVSTGTGTANAAKANVGPSAGNAAATGAAQGPTTKVAPTSGVSTGAGTANSPSASIKVTASLAAGNGQSFDATVSTAQATSADAGLASGTGAASDATVGVAPVVAAATATGAAAGVTAKVSPVVSAATATGTSFDATATTGSAVNASAGVATGTGAASGASASLAATAGHAFGTGAALGPDVSVSIQASTAAGSGAAHDATGSLLAAILIGGQSPGAYAMTAGPSGRASNPIPR